MRKPDFGFLIILGILKHMQKLKNLFIIGKAVGEAIGNFMSRLILSIIYLLIVPFFAGIQYLIGDPFHKPSKGDNSSWLARNEDAVVTDIKKLRMPY